MVAPIAERTATQANSTSEVQPTKRFDVLEEYSAVMMALMDNYDDLLSKKIAGMKAKTQQSTALNGVMTALNKIKNSFPSDAKPSDKVNKDRLAENKKELEDAVKLAGINLNPSGQRSIEELLSMAKQSLASGPSNIAKLEQGIEDYKSGKSSGSANTVSYNESEIKRIKDFMAKSEKDIPYLEKGNYPPDMEIRIFDSDTTKNKVDDAINTVQGLIDSANSTSQMEQLELQQLMSKRSNALESLSSVIKKYFDVFSSIVSKM
ncbi:hypothetical protein [Ottowia thiooxydans]|uniref:Translocator protein BipD n=1 Tax=Ottowia thiooxydans TaxID=219182 RepID=A0ABV2QHT9_9BURK